MGRTERKLFLIGDELAALDEERRQVEAELEFHRHLQDDAERDAIVSGSEFERHAVGAGAMMIRRFVRRLDEIDRRRAKLNGMRTRLLERLD
jgi:hypothetical protein